MVNKYWLAFRQIKKEIKEYLKSNYRLMFEILMFLVALLGIVLTNDQNRIVWMILIVFSFVLLLVLGKFIKTIQYVQKPIKRFTRKNESGDIIVEEERLHQALIYLSILEDQIEQ